MGLFMAVMIGIGATMGPGIFALTIRAYFLPEASIALLTLITTVVFTAINFKGMKEAIIVIAVMNLVELAVLGGIAALGFTDIEPRNLEPLAPMGWGPFVPAMAFIYISYVGFELISNAAEEIIQPSKNIWGSV
jgi:amino acid transporter